MVARQPLGVDVNRVGTRTRIATPGINWSSMAGRMLVWGVVLPALVLAAAGAGSATANGADVCPEPNDALQAACNLGTGSDALGFISTPDDVDAYRVEAHDYGARVHLALPDRPHPYRLTLIDYDGDVLQSTDGGTIDTMVDLPGTYYALVNSATGESDETAPYRIELGIGYPMGVEPTVLYSEEYGIATHGEMITAEGDARENGFSDDVGRYRYEGGHLSVQLTTPGSPDKASATVFSIIASDDPPPTMADFTMTIDTQMMTSADAGYSVIFRTVDEDNHYQVLVGLQDHEARLSKMVNHKLIALTPWISVPGVRETGINRTIIRCVGTEIQASINGEPLPLIYDDTFSEGLVGFGAGTWGDPTTINFDNVLVTMPTHR
jgi:hypothetical protein